MPKSLSEYVDWLDARTDLIWPQPPRLIPVAAKPHLKALTGVRAVVWNLYGTLLRITDGELIQLHHQQLRMQVALEKTINEFNMWHSMTRKPGAPWESMLQQFRDVLEEMELSAPVPVGEFAQVSTSRVWRKLIGRLDQKEYQYDEEFYGDRDELAEKVAYFYHANLQGVEAAPQALQTLTDLAEAGIVQGMIADAQSFSLAQLIRALRKQGPLPPLNRMLDSSCLALSYQVGVRKPSKSLYEACLRSLIEKGIQPQDVLYVGTKLVGDLAVAREYGCRTVLYAGDAASFKATATEINHPDLRPKRLVTELHQIRGLISGGES